MWHFCSHANILKIEKMHKTSLNVVLNDYLSPYNIILEKVKRPTLYVLSRMKSIGLEVFKCLHKCSPTYITDMFSISASPYDTRGGIKLIQPRVNSTPNGLKSFRYHGAEIWNELPTSVKNTEDVSEFKYRLNEWPGSVCKCGSCELCKFINIWTASCHSPLILYAHMILLSWSYIYILYANYLHISIGIYLYAWMYIRLCLCTNRCICMYVYVHIDVAHSHLRLYIIIFSSS